MKYGFILNSEGCLPENYSGTFKSDKMEVFVVGTENQAMARQAAKDLADRGIEVLDLCGDFKEDLRNDIRAATGNRISVRSAEFFPEQGAKLGDIDWQKFGFVVLGEGLHPDTHVVRLQVPACHLTMVGVSSVEEGGKAVQDMIEGGIQFFELSRFFDEQDTLRVIAAADETGKLYALGSVGIGEQK